MNLPDLPTAESPNRPDRLAAWALRGPLTIILVGLATIELASWIPHYLTWPWFADSDVFATAAQAWESGQLPYRDYLCNNFPGTIYLFWILGKLGGWGRTALFNGADAAMVVILGLLLLAWSRRRFGRLLPGAAGYLTFLGSYLGLDTSQVAQRDWQGPFFAVAGLLVAEAWAGRLGRVVSAVALALAIAFRPQTVLFLPAMIPLLLVSHDSRGSAMRAGFAWGVTLTLALTVLFAPLVLAGVGGDFLRSVKVVAYGGDYSQARPLSFLKEFAVQLAPIRIGAVFAAILLLSGRLTPRTKGVVLTWMVATACVLLYKPLSPRPHAYLTHPLMLIWSVDVAILVELILGVAGLTSSVRLAVVLLVLGLGVSARPRFCNPSASLRALVSLRRGEDPPIAMGYTTNPLVPKAAYYPWDDYRQTLHYLRTQTAPDIRVANALKGIPALTGPAGRLSAFPAESIGWLLSVRPDDEARFAEALAQTPQSVVIWSPAEQTTGEADSLEILTPVIRRLYEPAARFGRIEIWKRVHPN